MKQLRTRPERERFSLPKDLHTGRYRIEPGHEVRLSDFDPIDTSGFEGKNEDEQIESKKLNEKLRQLQEMLYAEHEQKVLVVLQAMDTGGKDGVINRVFKDLTRKGSASPTSKNPLLRNLIMVSCGENTSKCLERGSLRFLIEAITRAFSSREFTRSFLRKSGVIGTGRSTISSDYSMKRTRPFSSSISISTRRSRREGCNSAWMILPSGGSSVVTIFLNENSGRNT